jgi:hypothetical protein
MEALYARGFTSREDVLDHVFEDFQPGAHGHGGPSDHAAAIYATPARPL